MTTDLFERMTAAIERLRPTHPVGRVSGASGGMIAVSGLHHVARLGHKAKVKEADRVLLAEVIRIQGDTIYLLPEGPADGICVGDRVQLDPPAAFAPDHSWIGRVVDPDGNPLDGRPLLPGLTPRQIHANPPPPHTRRAMGARLDTGFAVFNTLLPLARGQRIGLFAGSGVGKSTLLADLARMVQADVIVIGLVGERGRELRHFVEEVLGPEGMKRSVVVAATSDRAPQVRRRAAQAATAVAEYFRDAGAQVLLLIDSVTQPELVRADPGHFIYAVTRGGYTFSPNVNGYTFDEIKSNGDLGIFKDPRLALDLMTFYSGIQQKGQWSFLRSQSQFEYIRRSAGVLNAEQLALVPDASSRKIHTDDVEGTMAAYQRMLDRPEFLEWVPVTLDYRRTDLQYGMEILKAAQDLRDRVRAELGQPPVPHDPATPAPGLPGAASK